MSERNVCGRCGHTLKSHESMSLGNAGVRCYRCFNEETAVRMGVDFDSTPLQPVSVSDVDGVEHRFDFRSMLVPTGRVLHARERVHVERGELGWRINDARHLVGRITWDPERGGEVPLLVIDGRPFTWVQVGQMLMSFEGFTLRAFVGDSIEVI